MKIMFIEARARLKIRLPAAAIKKLPKKVGLFTTVQFLDSLEDIRTQLENAGKKVKLFRAGHAGYRGQVLGCSVKRFPGVDAFLYVGDGRFHPAALALKNSQPVFIFNPLSRTFSRLRDYDVKRYRMRMDAGLKKFLMSESVGILVSTKPGQQKLRQAIALKKRLKKRSYILVSDDIDFSSLENFPFIECFVNTACPRIGYDDATRLPRPVVNIEDVISSSAG